MSTLMPKDFEDIYERTYQSVLKYIVCKCQNLDDVNELLQDSYLELYRVLNKKQAIDLDDEIAYIIGICKNILKKYYRNKYKEKNIYFLDNVEEKEFSSNINLETDIITHENVEEIWEYLNRKNVLIAKIFYLYYAIGLKIIEIAEELQISESTVKNYMYRTLKELKERFGKGEE